MAGNNITPAAQAAAANRQGPYLRLNGTPGQTHLGRFNQIQRGSNDFNDLIAPLLVDGSNAPVGRGDRGLYGGVNLRTIGGDFAIQPVLFGNQLPFYPITVATNPRGNLAAQRSTNLSKEPGTVYLSTDLSKEAAGIGTANVQTSPTSQITVSRPQDYRLNQNVAIRAAGETVESTRPDAGSNLKNFFAKSNFGKRGKMKLNY